MQVQPRACVLHAIRSLNHLEKLTPESKSHQLAAGRGLSGTELSFPSAVLETEPLQQLRQRAAVQRPPWAHLPCQGHAALGTKPLVPKGTCEGPQNHTARQAPEAGTREWGCRQRWSNGTGGAGLISAGVSPMSSSRNLALGTWRCRSRQTGSRTSSLPWRHG